MSFKKWKYILELHIRSTPRTSVFPMYILNDYLKYSFLSDSIFTVSFHHFVAGYLSTSILGVCLGPQPRIFFSLLLHIPHNLAQKFNFTKVLSKGNKTQLHCRVLSSSGKVTWDTATLYKWKPSDQGGFKKGHVWKIQLLGRVLKVPSQHKGVKKRWGGDWVTEPWWWGGRNCGVVGLPIGCAEFGGVAFGYHVGSAFLRHRVSLSHPSSWLLLVMPIKTHVPPRWAFVQSFVWSVMSFLSGTSGCVLHLHRESVHMACILNSRKWTELKNKF